ncbi:unnamed protein product [Candidula unifasciata]|uniref:K Homology domain-containing protein n=1 Tax=Candidula unifasciata TaxID=100452 RepID=A0A8S3ZRW5_9EUPU|nr:unnamed protein product [Candidula unifasciata]
MSYSSGYGRGQDDAGGSSTSMKVDSSCVGKIIGRGGTKIRELEQTCRARIKISRDADEDGMKCVEICGSDSEIEKAKRMIEECLAEGRGGSRIRDMEADSGCRIKVSRDGDSRGRSSVELSGSKGAITEAKRLIQEAGVEIVNGDDRGRGW